MQSLEYARGWPRHSVLQETACPRGAFANVDGRCVGAAPTSRPAPTVYLITSVPYAHGGALSSPSLASLRCLRDGGDDCQSFVPSKR